MRILLVDDEPDILDQAKIFLKKEVDLDIDTSTSAGRALELLENNAYDGIVSDYQMPEMDGLEFLKTIREEKKSDIPFIMFTGKGREEVAIEALNLGADRYLQKGGSPKSQYSVLARAIVQEVERSKADEALLKSEEKFRIIFENEGTATGIVREDGVIRQCNAGFAELVGYSKSDITGKMKWSDFVVKEDLERLQQYGKQRFEKGGAAPTQYECGIVNRKGDVRTVVVTMAMQEKDLIVSLLDITERKEAEEKYTFESNLLNSLLDNAHDLVYFKDREGRYLRVSEAYADALGLDRGNMVGKTLFELYPEDQAKQMHEDDLRVMEKGVEVVDREHEVMLSGGANRWLSTTKVPRYDDEGNVIGMIGISRDVTERREWEKKIKQYKDAVEALDDSIYMIDRDFKYVFANREHLSRLAEDGKIPQKVEDEVIGKKYGKIHRKEEAKTVKKNVRKVIESESPWTEEYEFSTKDRWSCRTYSPVKNTEAGEVEGVVVVSKDINERKRAEEELKESEEEYRKLSEEFELILDHIPGIVFYKDPENN